MRKRLHKKPYTDEERIADGQQRFEFHDEQGRCVYHCYRPHFWQAHRAWKYHLRRMEEVKAKREQAKKRMRMILSDFVARVEMELRKEKIKSGAIGFNELTFFDL